jgi:aminoglycoside phosphotransferase (APT) family kinase protein
VSAVPQPDRRLRAFLLQQRIAQPDDVVTWAPLAGGVSSDIWRVDVTGRSLCIKRALPTLKVAQPWHAPIERNAYEWAWMNFAAKHCPGSVPVPVASDPVQGVFAMEYLDAARYPVWKRLLLDGVVDTATAARTGAVIAALHAASARDETIAARFRTDAIFHAIRLEPYLLATAARHPDLARALCALSERTAETRIALVHGDVSPKNILLGPKGPVFLDAECAWYGDPAFDAAFCLNHFLLKCVARPPQTEAYLACFTAFAGAYLAGVAWESATTAEERIASLLPALFLARVDGKSPVEYITDERDKRIVRETARPLIANPPHRVAELAACWKETLTRSRAAGGNR